MLQPHYHTVSSTLPAGEIRRCFGAPGSGGIAVPAGGSGFVNALLVGTY